MTHSDTYLRDVPKDHGLTTRLRDQTVRFYQARPRIHLVAILVEVIFDDIGCTGGIAPLLQVLQPSPSDADADPWRRWWRQRLVRQIWDEYHAGSNGDGDGCRLCFYRRPCRHGCRVSEDVAIVTYQCDGLVHWHCGGGSAGKTVMMYGSNIFFKKKMLLIQHFSQNSSEVNHHISFPFGHRVICSVLHLSCGGNRVLAPTYSNFNCFHSVRFIEVRTGMRNLTANACNAIFLTYDN